jgi:hypothetical protein
MGAVRGDWARWVVGGLAVGLVTIAAWCWIRNR